MWNMTNEAMKAVRLQLKPGKVLVRVPAVGINPPDWYLREGYKALPPEWSRPESFPIIPGADISGVVSALTDDVNDFSVWSLGDGLFFPSGKRPDAPSADAVAGGRRND